MAKRKTQAKTSATVAAELMPSSEVAIDPLPKLRRRTPAWHRQYLRRLAVHGNKSRAAKESGIDYRQAIRVERAKPRFRKGVLGALKIADARYAERLATRVEEIAIEGVRQPVYQAGKYVGSFQRYLPALTRHVLDTVSPRYRARADAKLSARHSAQSVSNISNTLNISLTQTQMDDPETLALMLALSDKLTQAHASPKAIDVTPPPADDA